MKRVVLALMLLGTLAFASTAEARYYRRPVLRAGARVAGRAVFGGYGGYGYRPYGYGYGYQPYYGGYYGGYGGYGYGGYGGYGYGPYGYGPRIGVGIGVY